MTCIANIEPQSEFEFYLTLTANPAVTTCCGPMVPIAFTRLSMSYLLAAFFALQLPEDYLDAYDSKLLDSDFMVIYMCSRHWIENLRGIQLAAKAYHVETWAELAQVILAMLCNYNNWDDKELHNYLQTFYRTSQLNGD